jgi:bacterial leucyl aminopeptidase
MIESDGIQQDKIQREQQVRKKLKKQIKANRIRRYVRAYSSIPSRHHLHSGNAYAVQALMDDLALINEGFTVRKQEFPHHGRLLANVEAILKSQGSVDDGIVIICAHLDSTASGDPAFQPLIDAAPGADDDASGIAAVLTAARAITALAKAADRYREIRFVLFNAEEDRQAGSMHYAETAAIEGTVIAGVFDVDMIGYASSESIFELHAGFEDDEWVQAESLELAARVSAMCGELAPRLSPEIYPGVNDKRDVGEGFSDHTSFHLHGFPACLITENFFTGPGTITLKEPNPAHHLPEDEMDNLDFEYAADIARVVAGAVWSLATA